MLSANKWLFVLASGGSEFFTTAVSSHVSPSPLCLLLAHLEQRVGAGGLRTKKLMTIV